MGVLQAIDDFHAALAAYAGADLAPAQRAALRTQIRAAAASMAAEVATTEPSISRDEVLRLLLTEAAPVLRRLAA